MSTLLNGDIIRSMTAKSNVPLVFKDFVKNWPICQWNVEKWCDEFGDKKIPFRCMKRDFVSDEPCWERRCTMKTMSFRNFVQTLETSDEWMYFDYKYLHQWFGGDSELFKEVSWKEFGYPDKGASETTLWVGSKGAHTPVHQDTYGYNIVAQLHGTKRWILFPPETGGLKPTRVPYEESSVYSELNFYCPNNLDVFNGLSGARMVELHAGDALLVPQGWWHYVQNTDNLNITLNVWLPHINTDFDMVVFKDKSVNFYKNWQGFFTKLINFKRGDINNSKNPKVCKLLETLEGLTDDDKKNPVQMTLLGYFVPPKGRFSRKIKYSSTEAIETLVVQTNDKDCTTRVSEALIKILVAQICKDLPQETSRLLVNPNEDDISETPLTVLFLQLESVANTYLDNRRKSRRVKRQRTCEEDSSMPVLEEYDLKALLEEEANSLEVVPKISNEDLISLIKRNIREYANTNRSLDEDDVDGSSNSLCLTKAVIDAFSQGNVIELVKQNLYTRLSQSY